ncbi:hypothetical protein BDV12DRAFT_145551 [Aspergillus spectabilis]
MPFAETFQTTPPPLQPSDSLPEHSEQHLLEMVMWEGGNQDLMLVDWLCVDFRQKLLNVLYTSCQSNFNEARDLAKQKLLDLLERMASSENSHGSVYSPPSLDFYSPGTPPQILPPTPDFLHHTNSCDKPCPPLSLPTPAQQGTPEEEGLMCTQEDITYPDRTPQQGVRGHGHSRSPSGTGPGVVPSPISLDNNDLPADCSDFVNFNLLSDGEVFSIGTYAADNSSSSNPIALEYDLSEMELDEPSHIIGTSTTTTSVTPPDIDLTHHLTASHPEPAPSYPLTRALPAQAPHRTLEPPSAATHRRPSLSERRQRQTRAAARARCRSTASPSPSAVAQVSPENEVIEPSTLSSSSGWTNLIPNHLPSPGTVLATFTHHLGEGKEPVALLLTRLFYAICSPDALCQLRHAVKLGREKSPVIPVHSTNDLATTVQVLDHLDSMTTLSHILRRYYLVRLLEHRTKLEYDHVTAKQAWRRPKRMLKYDCARVELIKSGSNSSSSSICSTSSTSTPDSKSDPRPKYRSKSQALADLMQMLYPDLKPAVVGEANNRTTQECVYSRRLTKLRNRLSCARNWYKFEQSFPGGILALIPCAGRFSVSIDQIEKLPSNTVQMFLDYLREHRGAFLHHISQALGTDIFKILARTDTRPAFAFEKVDEDLFGDLLYDTDQLMNLCKHV